MRPGGEVVLRFSRPLDPATAWGAVRVQDEDRGGAPVLVEVEARGSELVLRARGGEEWRPGSVLGVRVAGLPSLSALRAAEGDALPGETAVRVQVRAPRRTDRVPPRLLQSEPADGAAGADPTAPVVLLFSEPMDARSLGAAAWAAAARGAAAGDPDRAPVLVSAGGTPVPCRGWLDRTRTELTVLPGVPLPAGTEVEVRLTDLVRDASGNPLAEGTSRRIAFTTAAAAPVDGSGRIVEAFEDRARLDPLGTTVRWDDPASPGVLSGVLEPVALEVGPGGDSALLLDPRGGYFRMRVTAADLGDEARVLKGLQLLAAPGSAPGEILEPAVRVAVPGGPFPADPADADGLPWQEVTEGLRGATARGAEGTFSLPFRHPVSYPGAGSLGLLVEVSWKGIAGRVILRAARHEDLRCWLYGAGFEPAVLRTAPVLRVETVGARAVARSRWMDAGGAASWQEARVRPAQDPGRVALQLQGAPAAADGAGPDLSRATAWTQDPAALEGMRWVRFRATFPDGEPGALPAIIDDIVLPFVAR